MTPVSNSIAIAVLAMAVIAFTDAQGKNFLEAVTSFLLDFLNFYSPL